MSETKFKFYSACVGWPGEVSDLHAMIESGEQIERRTFLFHVDREELKQIETDLGYSQHPKQGLTMAGDWHVDYRRGELKGDLCYFFVHSAIEFVFTQLK